MIIYFIKFSLCLLVLWGFYKVALENLNIHKFKRGYLLGALVVAVILPLITISYTTTDIVAQEGSRFLLAGGNAGSENSNSFSADMIAIAEKILWIIYFLGVGIFSIRFYKNVSRLTKDISNYENLRSRTHIKVLHPKQLKPFTFLKFIFLNELDFKENKIAPEILAHEKAHVIQRHTLDILASELIQIVFWFNPLLIFYKRSIQLNHEFLADQSAVKHHKDIKNYSTLLINNSMGFYQPELSSSFNHSLIKKRILMMSKPFSKKTAIGRIFLLLPILALCVYLFNNKLVAKPTSTKNSSFTEVITNPITVQTPGLLTVSIVGDDFIINGEKANLNQFAKILDAVTSKWTKDNFNEVQIEVTGFNGDEKLRRSLNREFSKSSFSKKSGMANLIPPAPPIPPKPPKAHKPHKAPKPHKFKKNNKLQKERQIVIVRGKDRDSDEEDEIELILDGEEVSIEELEQLKTDGKRFKIIVKSEDENLNARPRSDRRKKHYQRMENADFYLNDKKISREEAERVDKDDIINVYVKKVNGEKSEVRIKTEE